MNIYIIGSGTFGTAIANSLAQNKNNNVTLYSRSQQVVYDINQNNINHKYFPNTKLSANIKATDNTDRVSEFDIVFLAIPSSAIITCICDFKDKISKDQIIVNLSKGIFENGEIITDYLANFFNTKNIVSLKGPSFAIEIMENAKTLLTLAYSQRFQFDILSQLFKKTNIFLDSTKDIKGVEILSVVKNIYALFIGIIDAKYNSHNTRFMFMTKVFSEIRMLNKYFGGNENTLFLSCGLGDACLTSLNDLSRNRTLGLLIGKGFYESNSKDNTVVIEGLNSINTIYSLIDKNLIINFPILSKLHFYLNSDERRFNIDVNEMFNSK
ncbi:NAD(P)-binding domain-containing protein [Flavobacteriales bacterium]|nr:NAD(P)-binding domain-containing protein [Flavobacteriales bacterium]